MELQVDLTFSSRISAYLKLKYFLYLGKTTTAHMVCKEAGFDFIELNASDARSKRTLDEVVSELLSNKTLAGFTKSKFDFIKCY